MRNRVKYFLRPLAAAILMLSGTSFAADGDTARGRELADTCEGCHAVDSYTNVYPTYHVPRIAGQSEEYLVAALGLYRDGNRAHSTMRAQAASFTDQDLRDIAAYLSQLTPPLVDSKPKGASPEATVACQSCHGQSGVGQIPSYPILAGQHQDYIVESLMQYKRGSRKGPNAAVMQAQLLALSDDDIKAVAEFYADQDGLSILPLD